MQRAEIGVRDKIAAALMRSPAVWRTRAVLRRAPLLCGTALSRLVKRVLLSGKTIWIEIPAGVAGGLLLKVDPRFEPTYLRGDHEPWVQQMLNGEIRPGACFYDIGAHVGFFSLIAARLVGMHGCVVAIEPDPENAARLRTNVERNGMANIRVVEGAVWGTTGEVGFLRASGSSSRSQGCVGGRRAPDHEVIQVSAISVDDLVFVYGERRPDLIKIDVEGGERMVLQGARRVLAEVRPKLLCEVHVQDEITSIRGFLEGFGYSVQQAPVREHYPAYRQDYLWATNPG